MIREFYIKLMILFRVDSKYAANLFKREFERRHKAHIDSINIDIKDVKLTVKSNG